MFQSCSNMDLFLKNATIAIVLSPTGAIEKINDGALAQFSWSRTYVLGKNFFSLLSMAGLSYNQKLIKFILDNFVEGVFDFELQPQNNHPRLQCYCLKDDLDKRQLVITSANNSSIEDSSSSSVPKKLLQEIYHSINQKIPFHALSLIAKLGEYLPGVIHIKEAKYFTYLHGNKKFMEGYQLKEHGDYINKNIFDMAEVMGDHWPKGKAEEIDYFERDAVNNSRVSNTEESYIGLNGQAVINALSKIPIYDEYQEPHYILTIAIDQSNLIDRQKLKNLYKNLYANKKEGFKKFLYHIGLGRFSITEREFDCLLLFSHGKTYKEIGRYLSISPRTVETHIEHIKEKCNFNSSSAMLEEFAQYSLHP